MKGFEKVFFTDDCPLDAPIQSGIFYRTMKLGQFIQECENKGYHIVGLRVTEENNGELFFVKDGEK